MTKRILSAAVGLALLAVILLYYNTIVFNIAISAISFLATFEILHATRFFDKKTLSTVCLLFAMLVPFLTLLDFRQSYTPFILSFILILFVLLLRYHSRIKIEQVGLAFMVSTLIPLSLTTMIFLRDMAAANGRFVLLLALAGAWIGDTGAYFVGTFLGKHKLCPTISPKKTVEGFIGGIVATSVSFVIMGYIYTLYKASGGVEIQVNYALLFILGIICDLLGVMGDLSASIIKRQYEIKDFGNIMPGHGGVLDRFDSVLFVVPFMYMVFLIMNETQMFYLIK